MTRQEIHDTCQYDENQEVFILQQFSPLFDRTVDIWIYAPEPDKSAVITDSIAARINSFLQASPDERASIKNQIWAHYEERIADTDYSMVPEELLEKHDGNFEKANRAFFGLNNAEETFGATEIEYVYLDDYEDGEHLYFMVCCQMPWMAGTAVHLSFKDGEFDFLE